MKRNLLLSTLFSFFIAFSYGQDKGYVAISFGPSFPNGDFGSKGINNESAGFANTGAIIDISFTQKFGKHLGMTLLLRGQANGVDTEPFLDELYAENPSIVWTAESNSWGIGGFMGGIYGNYPLGNGHFSFEPRVMVGVVNATSPDILLTGYAVGQSASVKQHSADATAFAYLLGVGFKYNMGTHLCLIANFDYLAAEPEFKDVVTTSSLGTYETATFSQSFGTVNLGVGIGYRW
jgi:hypothetical protein